MDDSLMLTPLSLSLALSLWHTYSFASLSLSHSQFLNSFFPLSKANSPPHASLFVLFFWKPFILPRKWGSSPPPRPPRPRVDAVSPGAFDFSDSTSSSSCECSWMTGDDCRQQQQHQQRRVACRRSTNEMKCEKQLKLELEMLCQRV